MIGIDWGTTSFRAFRVSPRRRQSANAATPPEGILNVPDGRFGDTLREEIGPWLAAGEDRVLLSGMIGSRQGWKEAPYLPCPAGAAELAAALVDIGFDWAQVKLVPGLSGTDDAGVAEVMRGEETQVIGVPALLRDGGIACLPGTPFQMGAGRGRPHHRLHHPHDRRGVRGTARPHHPGADDARRPGRRRPVRCRRGALRRTRRPAAPSVRRARPGLAGRLAETEAPAYLSGILVGHEVRAALADAAARVGAGHRRAGTDLALCQARSPPAAAMPNAMTARPPHAAWR